MTVFLLIRLVDDKKTVTTIVLNYILKEFEKDYEHKSVKL